MFTNESFIRAKGTINSSEMRMKEEKKNKTGERDENVSVVPFFANFWFRLQTLTRGVYRLFPNLFALLK